MSSVNLFRGILVGAVFSAVLSAIYAGYVAITSETVGDFGLKAKDFWWLAMILGGFVGFVLGSFVGAIISQLNSNVILSAIVGLLVIGILILFLSQVASESKFDENHTRFGIGLIFIETITGIIVALTVKFIANK